MNLISYWFFIFIFIYRLIFNVEKCKIIIENKLKEVENMKFHYMGKFDGNMDSLPKREHEPGAVMFKEPDNIE